MDSLFNSVINISSDEEEVPLHQSTPFKYFPLNMIALNLSWESTIAKKGGEASTDETAPTFESGASPRYFGQGSQPAATTSSPNEDEIVGESHGRVSSESSYFEEPKSPLQMPPLQLARVLRDITNVHPTEYEPPLKIDRINDLDDPTVTELGAQKAAIGTRPPVEHSIP